MTTMTTMTTTATSLIAMTAGVAARTRAVTVRWFSDPGHGWLAVPAAAVRALGVDVSPYSYKGRAGVLYLEEDRDAGLFLQAARAAGWSIEELPEHVEGRRDSPIRNLPSAR